MKKEYYVNDRPQNNGDYEVHEKGCVWFPTAKTYLGEHALCHTAVAVARVHHTQVNGCKTCCPACHTS